MPPFLIQRLWQTLLINNSTLFSGHTPSSCYSSFSFSAWLETPFPFLDWLISKGPSDTDSQGFFWPGWINNTFPMAHFSLQLIFWSLQSLPLCHIALFLSSCCWFHANPRWCLGLQGSVHCHSTSGSLNVTFSRQSHLHMLGGSVALARGREAAIEMPETVRGGAGMMWPEKY